MSGLCCLIWLELAEGRRIQVTTCAHCGTQWMTEEVKDKLEREEAITNTEEVEDGLQTEQGYSWYVLIQGKDKSNLPGGGVAEPVHVSDYNLVSSIAPEENPQKSKEKNKRKK